MPPGWRNKPVLGLLVTTLKATKGTMEAIGRSHWPMGFVMMSRQGLIQQFLWNRAASDRGLQGVGVTVRHTPRILLSEADLEQEEGEEDTTQPKKPPSKFANAGTQKDIQLTWMGSPIFPERTTLDQETLDLMDLNALEDPPASVDTAGKPNRGPGRPRKEAPAVRIKKGPPATKHLAPYPRGGQVSKPRRPAEAVKTGRPKGAKNKVKAPSDAD